MTPPPELLKIVADAALRNGVDPALACAVCEQESNFDVWAARYEPAFFTRYIDKSSIHLIVREFCAKANFYISFETELRERAYSRGVMQTMGQTMREGGYTGPLAQMHDPATSAEWGTRLLRRLLDKCEGDVTRALLRWNGGADAAYPEKVIARMEKY